MTIRHRAAQFREANGLPTDEGFAIFFHGKPGGWMCELTAENARELKSGAIAVPGRFNTPLLTAVGEDPHGWGGSASWERVDPVFEKEGLL